MPAPGHGPERAPGVRRILEQRIQPARQADRRIREGEREGLRPSALDFHGAGILAVAPRGVVQHALLFRRRFLDFFFGRMEHHQVQMDTR